MSISTNSIIGVLIFSASLAANAEDVVFEYAPTSSDVGHAVSFERLAEPSVSSSTTQIAPYIEDSPLLSPSPGLYAGPSVFGGYQFASNNYGWFFSRQGIRDETSKPDTVTIQCYCGESWDTAEMALHAVFLFKQPDFEEGFQSGPVSVSGLSISWNSYFKGTERNVEGRFVVQNDGVLLVSDDTFDMSNTNSTSLNQKNLQYTKWATYEPEADLNFDSVAADFRKTKLDKVTAVGVYVEDDQWIGDDSTTSPFMLSISGFKATGSKD